MIASAINDPILSKKSFLKDGKIYDVTFEKLARGGHGGLLILILIMNLNQKRWRFEFFFVSSLRNTINLIS